ncbi:MULTISPECIES: CaiB/BaiF CoA-transferase family protein [unclassified Mycolicibacterium]|uniref:CaiB/BaiF CoA transferase family protein n=1 Tax=unclassified Mycolicibacterium TaxID=2636767 RepID=UPI001F4BE805|nr:CaiB/BaiF CoA-transferase family protein [Mycolicibacterium sp. YH-1]UNB50265.1 CoA transferase [Mycolicibacterium sp. YH-1]
MQPNASALQGLKVLEVGNYIAGPYCGTLLADLGATVTKIEDPHDGDVVRGFAPMNEAVSESSAFVTLNRNKRSIALDLKSERGREIFMTLARHADIVIENIRPGAMKRLGLDYETLSEHNAGLIYLSASGWGQDGPLSANAGLDIMAQARSGLMSVTGTPDGDPVKVGVPVCDIGCAMYGAIAVLAAVNHRHQTGEGQRIDVSLFESGVSYAIWEFARYNASGEIPMRRGSAHQTAAPYQAIRAADGWFTLGAATPKTWLAFCAAFEFEWMLDDERFATNTARMDNRVELIELIEARTLGNTRAHWLQILDAAGVPAAPINDYSQVFSDEHLLARDFFWESEHSSGGKVLQVGSPMRLSKTPAVRHSAGPVLGQNTAEALDELGYSPADIAELSANGVIAVSGSMRND